MREKIDQHYRVRLILDNLPITTYDLEENPESIRPGYEIGFAVDGKYYLNNHLMFKILVHKTNGQYSKARQDMAELEAAAVVEVCLLHAHGSMHPVRNEMPGPVAPTILFARDAFLSAVPIFIGPVAWRAVFPAAGDLITDRLPCRVCAVRDRVLSISVGIAGRFKEAAGAKAIAEGCRGALQLSAGRAAGQQHGRRARHTDVHGGRL